MTQAKKAAARHAVDKYVKSNSVIGLGTGSTADFVSEYLAEKIKKGELKDVVCVPTSEATVKKATSLGLKLTSLDELPKQGKPSRVEVAIDGADEIDKDLNLIKGRGGALFREKLVELNSDKFIVVGDESKVVAQLGKGSFPIEIVKFSYENTIRRLMDLPPMKKIVERYEMRKTSDGKEIMETDNKNYIVDVYCRQGKIDSELRQLANDIKSLTGVVEHGLFLGMCSVAVVASEQGSVREISAQ